MLNHYTIHLKLIYFTPEQLKRGRKLRRGRKAEAPATPNRRWLLSSLPHTVVSKTLLFEPRGSDLAETAGAVLPSSYVMRSPKSTILASGLTAHYW